MRPAPGEVPGDEAPSKGAPDRGTQEDARWSLWQMIIAVATSLQEMHR